MSAFEIALTFIDRARTVESYDELASLLRKAALELGFQYFALVNHVDLGQRSSKVIRIENYPPAWAEYFVANRLFADDPIHRACLVSKVGFEWSDVPTKIPMTRRQWSILEMAAEHGLRTGYTVPVTLPGEISGSCSFAGGDSTVISGEVLPLAELVGGFALEAARRLLLGRSGIASPFPRLTTRQRECLLLAMHGKTDWEIGKILDLSKETVTQHLEMARQKYGTSKRMPLAIRALFDGQISFIEALEGQFPITGE